MVNVEEKLKLHYDTVAEKYGEENILGVVLFGSQNYGCEYEGSDVDTKAILLPTLEDLLKYKQISTQITLAVDGSICDVKHLRLMFENFLKQNINFVELLYSPYYRVDKHFYEFMELKEMRKEISTLNPLRMLHAAAGMAHQKAEMLEKPFAGKEAVLAKYGYDPKQLASCARLRYFVAKYMETLDFDAAIHPSMPMREYILMAKRGKFDHAYAKEDMEEMVAFIDEQMIKADQLFKSDLVTFEKREAKLKEWFDFYYLTMMKKKFKEMN